MHRYLFSAALFLFAFMRPLGAVEVAPDRITNTASLTCIDPKSGKSTTINSRQVDAVLRFNAPFVLKKTAANANPIPGTPIVYTLDLTRNAGSVASPVTVNVDGVSKQVFLLADPIPAHTIFVKATPSTGAQLLYHLRGAATDDYTIHLPRDLSTVDIVAAGYASLPYGAKRSIQITLSTTNSESGRIVNTATMQFMNHKGTLERIAASAPVVLQGSKPKIEYYDPGYDHVIGATRLGDPLYVQVTSALMNANPNVVDHGTITLISTLTGDRETIEVVETGPDTGIFRAVHPVPTRSALTNTVTAGNNILETVANDSVVAEFNDPMKQRVTTNILVDPAGVVFDSQTNQPLAGAQVTLINIATGLPAAVFGYDGVTSAPNTVTTGADGRYVFPSVAPGTYQLRVVPPAGYVSPSRVLPTKLPRGHTIDPNGSYGGTFVIRSGIGAVLLDIPLDPNQANSTGLFIEKTASRATVELGEFVDYSVVVKNVLKEPLRAVSVTDRLPFGFIYVKKSARLGKYPLRDPSSYKGTVVFEIGRIDAGASVTLTYRVRVAIGAQQGDGVNHAQAYDAIRTGVTSNTATARVEIQSGVFTNDGIIFGKIYVDFNRNKIQDEGPEVVGSKEVVDPKDSGRKPRKHRATSAVAEPGVPGVRLFLEDGSYVVTDVDGKFSLYGIHPRLHVLKVDRTTLPPGAKLEVLSSRNAGDPGSRFVDLKFGEMHKADFAIVGADENLMENVRARRAAAEAFVTEVESNLAAPLTQDGSGSTPTSMLGTGISSQNQNNLKALPASGILGVGSASNFQSAGVSGGFGGGVSAASSLGLSGAPSDAAMPRMEQAANAPWSGSILQNRLTPIPGNVPNTQGFTGAGAFPVSQPPFVPPSTVPATAAVPSIPLEAATKAAGPGEFGFIDLHDGETLASDQVTIRIRGNAAAKLTLLVNGVEVPESRIGKKIVAQSTQVQSIEYVSVGLKPGSNQVEVLQRDPFGNVRGRQAIAIIAPGNLGKIIVELPKSVARADGKTPVPVIVHLVDANGTPVSSRTEITLDSSVGEWAVRDCNPRVPGVQVFIEGGRGEYFLKPPLEAVDAAIRVNSGQMQAATQLSFLPELRPLLAVGLLEGQINFRDLSSTVSGRRKSNDGFNDEITRFATSSGDTDAGARTAFFIKGQVTGEYVLTASYDSEKRKNERLFRDIQPDEFYPIYGDSSLKGFDAQSTSEAYVKIENKKSYLLYGDFTTESNTEARSLSNYSRSLTGVKWHFENKTFALNAWGSYDSNRQVVVEIPGNGTSGPYAFQALGATSGLTGSEKVEVLIRDRNQNSVIIKATPMSRLTDYEFEPFSGRILFRTPIPSVDEDLNPISVRITYVVDQGVEKFWVYGGDAQVRVTKWLELGGSFVQDKNPIQSLNLYSADAVLRLSQNTYFVAEAAQSETPLNGTGNALRFDLRHTSERVTAHAFWGRTDDNFVNQTSSLSAGRVEGGAEVTWRLNNRTNIHLQAVDSETTSGGARRGVLTEVQYSITPKVRLDIGGRYSTQSGDVYGTGGSANDTAANKTIAALTAPEPDVASLRAKLSIPFPGLKNGTLYGEYENDLNEIDRRMAAVGAEYQASEKTKVYARHEFISSLTGPFDLNNFSQTNTTVIGVQSEFMKTGQLFNEYRMNSVLSGREGEAALGLRNQWTISDGLRVQGSFERVSPVVFGRGGRTITAGTSVNPALYGTGVNNPYYNGAGYGAYGGVGGNSVYGSPGSIAGATDSVSITGAFDYTAENDWKLTGRAEWRTSDTEDSILTTLGYARKLTDDWSVLSKVLYYDVTSNVEGGGNQEQLRLQLGFAYRPVRVNFWNALAKYELRLENGSALVDQTGDRLVHIISGDVNWQPASYFTLSGHYAAKYAEQSTTGLNSSEFANLIGIRALVDIGSHWDAGFNARALFDAHGRTQYGFGPEIGYRLRRNMRIAAGYNIFGLSDPDLTDDEYSEQGFYITLRMKFDENLLSFGKKDEEGEK